MAGPCAGSLNRLVQPSRLTVSFNRLVQIWDSQTTTAQIYNNIENVQKSQNPQITKIQIFQQIQNMNYAFYTYYQNNNLICFIFGFQKKKNITRLTTCEL